MNPEYVLLSRVPFSSIAHRFREVLLRSTGEQYRRGVGTRDAFFLSFFEKLVCDNEFKSLKRSLAQKVRNIAIAHAAS